MKRIFPIAVAALLAGCVSMGTNYDPAAVDRLRTGMTRAEVVQMLGKPNTMTTFPDGRVQLGWVHSTGSMFGANARSVILLFDAGGLLLQTSGQSQIQIK